MRQIPAMTFRGALRILGHHDSPALGKLDKLLGGAILAAGALTFTGAAPLVALGAIWGWVDQKNEAVGLLRRLAGKVSDRRLGLVGYERSQLVAAAHTVLATSAVLESLRTHIGEKTFEQLKITPKEQQGLIGGQSGQHLVDSLYELEVPLPSASRPFHQNLREVGHWQRKLVRDLMAFCSGLSAWDTAVDEDRLAALAVGRYRDGYYQLAAQVPEFMVWVMLTEHEATHTVLRKMSADVRDVLSGHAEALSRLDSLFSVIAEGTTRPQRDVVTIVHQANRAVLDEPIVPRESTELARLNNIRFPLVRQIYLQPRYRCERVTARSHVADEQWWKYLPVFGDIDVRLAAHFATPEATRLPLLLLGHPGAGKSLLAKMLAARLPISSFTTVYVPLRRVTADAPIYEQVQQALAQETHGRADWARLTEQTDQTLRVILLDGLDELLQASDRDRTGFLHEVADFQRREADLGKPVAVVVTSRTVVADRVEIPTGTPVVKLEDFSKEQISTWRDTWNSVNRDAIEAGTVRALSAEGTQEELASQPLLLLMLALYSANPELAPIESGVSKTTLYGMLLEDFTQREASKNPEDSRDRLHELSTAALAMFNRGRQYVTDVELGADLAALASAEPIRLAETGQHVIAQFFFVHTAQAQVGSEKLQRSYEFLHATFGEYLVAREVVEALRDTAASAITRRGTKEPDDDLLFALLSHDCLAIRRPILTFAGDILHELAPVELATIVATLDTMIGACRHRPSSDRYSHYRPAPLDRVREIAAYSANLVLLRTMVTGGSVPLAEFLGDDNTVRLWRSTLDLWRAGLTTDAWHALLSTLVMNEGKLYLQAWQAGFFPEAAETLYAYLAGDRELVLTLRMGLEVRDRWKMLSDDEEELLRRLVRGLTLGHKSNDDWLLALHPDRLTELLRKTEDSDLHEMLAMLLKQRAAELPVRIVEVIVEFLLKTGGDPYALIAAIHACPSLLSKYAKLGNPDRYTGRRGTALMLKAASERSEKVIKLIEELEKRQYQSGQPGATKRAEVTSLLKAYQWD